ncbi:MAG: HEAT repeat domain-containing protein [Symploca sp. SIO2E6]|nr:HEAT repeat domain-containing protein [Symploca sp. SIO2E6]
MIRQYHVLETDPSELSFLDTMQDALDLIEEQYGTKFSYTFYEKGGEGLGRHIYTEEHEQAIISLVVDFAIPTYYLIIEAPTQEKSGIISSWLNDILSFTPLDTLQENARSQMHKNPQSLVRMALGAGKDSDSVSLEILLSALRSQAPLVRFRAAEAASLTGWPEFKPLLEFMSQSDESNEVREMASQSLKAFR